MSRIGKLPIPVPQGVTVTIEGRSVKTSGPKGTLEGLLPPKVSVEREGDELIIKRDGEDRIARSMHGLARSLVRNMVDGVAVGFTKTLEIVGVGYKVEERTLNKHSYLVFTLGYSHPIYYEVPKGISAQLIKKGNDFSVALTGADRQLVGSAAAAVRAFRPPEPYKGKGIKYSDEIVRRKEGKSGAR
ncbi:50S ribosomal protein L6 [Myxococcota bacterium]|nr:50S ribosomal protein L6 [Myxococcota bacterium]MBU1430959.1 50S ribosomal protein L6 [Myxococcota bacterium]MBU1897246.1 50S ribosomal protein L6 [Myxococcota bacterium]